VDQDSQFKAVVEANGDRVYRICCCHIRDEHERQDAYQEVLVHIWRGLSGFDGRSVLSTWIYRITVNTCMGHLRAVRRRNRLIDDRPLDDPGLPTSCVPAADAALEDDVRKLHECVRQLPPVDKTLISLYLEDIDAREIGQILGISEGNVRVRLHRTKEKLRDLWESHGHEPRQCEE